jgi:hypothetical protein
LVNSLVKGKTRRPSDKEASDIMVVVGASIEPVSNSNSLLTGKLTGNFVDSGSLARFSRQIGKPIQLLAAKFPRKRNREFWRPNREFFWSQQGI